jgi:hypothetical protein
VATDCCVTELQSREEYVPESFQSTVLGFRVHGSDPSSGWAGGASEGFDHKETDIEPLNYLTVLPAYLLQLRWPDGFRCPRCRATKGWALRERGLMQCAACGRQTSVTAGTIFQDIRTPLPVWFRAMWAVTSQKTGISALGLQRELGLGSYKTAWAWLHKLRRAMVRPGRDRLTGRVEVDEAYIGGIHPGRGGRQTATKALVAVAVQVEAGGRLGRIRLRRLLDASGDRLMG